MKKVNSINELKETILLLELKQANDKELLKEQFKVTYESLKPINLIKGAFSDLTSSSDIKNELIDTTLGVTAGYISKKAVVGSSHNPLKQILGTLIQMGVSNLVSKNAHGIRSVVGNLITTVLSKRKDE